MRVAIYGAGSLGTILGAFISKGGAAIELINRNSTVQPTGGGIHPRRDERRV